ncbi:hypothetical protein C9374_009735 [Naegleria lovaniensis]|uniref:Lebercilin domain-containing protein n=1 Tax=Naegleria lovaniensis TaxID=51637 RepID=A0AA88KPI3_NAELO|nr:uncharacterized protein C9374_009735 [Naegleria lovaniensis]KAG2393158.1 hypothetical protein C9374_009735 [Naegleria lovaniensis]
MPLLKASECSSQTPEEKMAKKIDLLNSKLKKYEEILDRKNKELTELQTNIETYKKKTINYSENNSAIAVRNASLERACREITMDKMKLEKENAKLRESLAKVEGQLLEHRRILDQYLRGLVDQGSGLSSSHELLQHSTTSLRKDVQLKITKYLQGKSSIKRNASNDISHSNDSLLSRETPVHRPQDVPNICATKVTVKEEEAPSPINRPSTPSHMRYSEYLPSPPSPKHSLPSDVGSTSSRKKQRRWNSPVFNSTQIGSLSSPTRDLAILKISIPVSSQLLPCSSAMNGILEEDDEILFF